MIFIVVDVVVVTVCVFGAAVTSTSKPEETLQNKPFTPVFIYNLPTPAAGFAGVVISFNSMNDDRFKSPRILISCKILTDNDPPTVFAVIKLLVLSVKQYATANDGGILILLTADHPVNSNVLSIRFTLAAVNVPPVIVPVVVTGEEPTLMDPKLSVIDPESKIPVPVILS